MDLEHGANRCFLASLSLQYIPSNVQQYCESLNGLQFSGDGQCCSKIHMIHKGFCLWLIHFPYVPVRFLSPSREG